MFKILPLLLLSMTATAQDWALYGRADLSYVWDEASYYFSKELPPEGATVYEVHGVAHNVDSPRVAFTLEMGAEWRTGWAAGWRHVSTPEAGCPLDCSAHEYFKNELFIAYKIGGLK